jgi:hypothetical protein
VRKMTIGELLDMFDPPPFAEAAAHTWRGSHAQADLGADVLPARRFLPRVSLST